jgi:pyrroline-5-carboxylate reductase
MKDNILIIGAGVIGGSIVRSLLKSGYEGKITASDIQLEKLKELEQLGVTTTSNNKKVVNEADLIFLCVKPKILKTILTQICKEAEKKLVVSTAAAVPIRFYKKLIPKAHFIRIMPNLAISVQESFTAYCCDDDVPSSEKNKVKQILDFMGISMEIEEQYMDAITAVSGSGPGYISIIIEAIFYAGLKVGLPRELALISATQAVLGTAKLVLKDNQNPAQIRDSVTTPGGTTIEAIYEVEGSEIRQSLMRAIEAATKKSEKIRKQWE